MKKRSSVASLGILTATALQTLQVGTILAVTLLAVPSFADDPCMLSTMPDPVYHFFKQELEAFIEEGLQEGSGFETKARTFFDEGEAEVLERLREVPWPDLNCWTWANVYSKDGNQHGSWIRVGDDDEIESLFLSDFTTTATLPREAISEVRPADFEAYLSGLVVDVKKSMYSIPRPSLEELSGVYPWGLYGCGSALHHAYAAATMNYWGVSERILRHLFEERHDPFDCVYNLGAWQILYHSIELLEDGAPRTVVLSMWERVLRDYPESSYEEKLLEQIPQLREQIGDEDQHVEGSEEDYEYLSTEEKISFATTRFPDVHGEQVTDPGECSTLNYGEGTRWSGAVVEIGAPAIPALIELLRDRRFTRSVGFHRSWAHSRIILRVQDVALKCIEAILGVRFYVPHGTSDYFSTEGPDVREGIVTEIRQHWAKRGAAGTTNP